MAQYDPFYIEERLKQFDPDLRIEWDPEDQVHEVIYRNPVTTMDEIVMTVKPGELDARVYTRILEIDRRRGYNPFLVIDQALEEKERQEEKQIEDIALDMAENLRKPLIEDYFY